MSSKMFGNTMKFLKEINGQSTYSMDVYPDADGYLDKECPNTECLSKFKVNADDWEKLFSDDAIHCPFCGYTETSDKWWTTEQIEQAKQQAINNIKAQLGQALQKDTKDFNRNAPKGFISMKMSFKGTTHAVNLPAKTMAEMQQKITCEKCGARYAVIGSAFYCPCCGHNSARLTFYNTIEKVKSKINNLEVVRNAISEYDKDEADRTCTSLLESSIPDLVVSIQRLCECIYVQLPNSTTPKKNAFQRLDEGNSLWKVVCGQGYDDWLEPDEMIALRKCFQQRHLLQHQEGIVDSDYLAKSGDTKIAAGQRLIIKKETVIQYASIVEKLGREIFALLQNVQDGH